MTGPLLSSFALVAASEMGDKTQLLAFSLAARFRKPGPILAGILVATLANHALASLAGSWVAATLGPKTLGYLLGALFIAFGAWTLVPDTFESADDSPPRSVFLTTAILFFLAEMGDKTQFATMALGARFGDPVVVTIGTTLGMMVSDGLAVLLGDRIAHRVQMRSLRIFAALLFFAFGVWSLFDAWRM
jgi:putative Ca2+/H+ antiporter (TMEM165/GDT1 family)